MFKVKVFCTSRGPTLRVEQVEDWGFKMEVLLPDVVVQEKFIQLQRVMEGEGKKNCFTTRQHVLLPVFVSTYYVLPVCSRGWGNFKKRRAPGPKRRSHLTNNTNICNNCVLGTSARVDFEI